MRPALLNPLFAEVKTIPGVGPKLAPLFDRLLTGEDKPARIVDHIKFKDQIIMNFI